VTYEIANARHTEQADKMRRLGDSCALCVAEHMAPLLWNRAGWRVARNRWPYEGTGLHLLAWPVWHVEDLADVPDSTWIGLGLVLRWARLEYGLSAFGLAGRSGDPTHTGATIRHSHLHLVTGDGHSDVKVTLAVASTVRSIAATGEAER
jgi:hypothetical protein